MTLFSMTGFARTDGAWEDYRWTWEAKSVNGKGLDVRIRLPQGMEELERQAKAAVAKVLGRGHVNLSLQIERDAASGEIKVNEVALDRLIEAAARAAKKHGLKKPRAEELMGLRGILEVSEVDLDDKSRALRDASLLKTLGQCVDELQAMRTVEGDALKDLLTEQIDTIERLVAQAQNCAAHQPEAMRARLHQQIADLLNGSGAELNQDRVAQEAAYLAVKADVREELDRLVAHVDAARNLVIGGSPIGRKLDFLSQEFSREANTLCSKAADAEMSGIGLDLKAVIDQMREQVQNIE